MSHAVFQLDAALTVENAKSVLAAGLAALQAGQTEFDLAGLTQVDSVADVQPGEGKVLKMDGHRCAVYRDHEGQVTMLSAVCTHMGCLVRWNKAAETWDCPCHGSRFSTDGDVVAGPAETPLEKRPS